jgi:hypothetical protein
MASRAESSLYEVRVVLGTPDSAARLAGGIVE